VDDAEGGQGETSVSLVARVDSPGEGALARGVHAPAVTLQRFAADESWQLAPRPMRKAVLLTSWLVPVSCAATGITWGVLHGTPWGVAGGVALGLTSNSAAKWLGRGLSHVTRAYVRRQSRANARRRAAQSLDDLRWGLVCVRGTIIAGGAPFSARVSGREQTVLAHYRVTPAPGRRTNAPGVLMVGSSVVPAGAPSPVRRRDDELQGVPFVIATDQGAIRVEVDDGCLFDAPFETYATPADLSLFSEDVAYREARIGVGAKVEVIGTLVEESDPEAERVSDREPPRSLLLRGSERYPLMIRRV
jgi:hypothetical protein